jgi:kumamolisin
MGKTETHVDLPGSRREALHLATRGSPIDPNARFDVTVRVRRQPPAPLVPAIVAGAPATAPYPAGDAGLRHGATDEDLEAIAAFASTFDLLLTQTRRESGTVVLSGTSAAFQKAFDVELRHYEYEGGTYRACNGAIRVPTHLKDVVVGVFGLDDRPFARSD